MKSFHHEFGRKHKFHQDDQNPQGRSPAPNTTPGEQATVGGVRPQPTADPGRVAEEPLSCSQTEGRHGNRYAMELSLQSILYYQIFDYVHVLIWTPPQKKGQESRERWVWERGESIEGMCTGCRGEVQMDREPWTQEGG